MTGLHINDHQMRLFMSFRLTHAVARSGPLGIYRSINCVPLLKYRVSMTQSGMRATIRILLFGKYSFRHMLPDLSVGQQFSALPVRHVPLKGLFQCRFNFPTRLPAEFPARLFGIQGEEVGFVLLRRFDVEIKRRQPRLHDTDDLFHRPS